MQPSKKVRIGLLVFFGVAVIFIVSSGHFFERKTEAEIVFAHTTVRAEVADTESSRIRGLSGRAPLPDGAGMWFDFDASGTPGIWMKEMNFPLDILWFDEGLHVVFVKENALPESYPEVFSPPSQFSPARYVLEVPAGFVKKYGVSLGENVSLQKKGLVP